MRILVLMVLATALLGGSCGGGQTPGPPLVASDELRARIVAAVAPEGEIFHAEMRVVSPGESSEAETVEVWIDGANNRARSESPDRFEGRPMASVFVDGRSWSYDPWADRVDTYEIPAEELVKMPVQSPAVFTLDYVRELLTAEQWRVREEKPGGGRRFFVEAGRVLRVADEDHAEGTLLITSVELDTKTLLPVRATYSGIGPPDSEERWSQTVEFQRTEYVSPDQVSPDLFSPESLYELVGSQ